jgi:hypothetical protein
VVDGSSDETRISEPLTPVCGASGKRSVHDATADKIAALRAVAAEIDDRGWSPARTWQLDRLCADLARVGCFAQRSHEHRSMARRRLRGDVDVRHLGPGYASCIEYVEACLRPIQENAA